jgi:hypothetical protein
MNPSPLKKVLAPIIPYATIGIGLLVFHSAWLAIVGYHAGMIAIIYLSGAGSRLKESFRGNGFCIPVIAALAGACGGTLLYILWPYLGIAGGLNSYLRSIGLDERTWPAFLAYFIVMNPLIEEYYWRGYLAPVGKRIGLNDLVFSGYHLIVMAGLLEPVWLLAAFVCLTAGAWFWRQMNRLNGGLLASTVSHLTADATVILTIYFMSMR